MIWEDTSTGHRCTVHAIEFPRGEVCHQCADGPRHAIQVETLDDDDPELRAWVHECNSLARFCHRVGKALAAPAGKDDDLSELGEAAIERDCHAATKLISEGTKLKRLAFDMREKLREREHDLTLIRHEREMQGGRRHSH